MWLTIFICWLCCGVIGLIFYEMARAEATQPAPTAISDGSQGLTNVLIVLGGTLSLIVFFALFWMFSIKD